MGAAINAVRLAVEYGVDLRKADEFEQLYWDVFNYAMAELPTADAMTIPTQWLHTTHASHRHHVGGSSANGFVAYVAMRAES